MITALIDLMGTFFQAGNPGQMAVIARSMLATIPGDLVALQFLGLALYQLGQTEAAHRIFRHVAERAERAETEAQTHAQTSVEPAAVTNYREATRPAAGLADAWYLIGAILFRHGFRKAAERAFQASRAARGRATLPLLVAPPQA